MTRSNEAGKVGVSSVQGLSLGTESFVKDATFFFEEEADEFAAVINFQLVPSGRIHMNREAREHIVDFFQ